MKNKYWVGFTYGKSNRAQIYYVGRATASREEAIQAAKLLGQSRLFGHGIVKDQEHGTVILHTGRDS